MKKSILLSTMLFSSMLVAENLIKNGSFEEFDKSIRSTGVATLKYWDQKAEIWSNRPGRVAVDGEYKVELDRRRVDDSISQTITTQEGKKYLFRVDAYARVKKDTCNFELLVDNEVIGRFHPNKYWQKYGATFIGKGGEQTITIREVKGEDDGYGALIDNVVIQSDETNIVKLQLEDKAKYEILEPWGLDQVIEVIDNDRKLQYKYDQETIQKAKDAAVRMNEIIKDIIYKNGLANDEKLTGADALEINRVILENYKDEFEALRADFSKIEKYGKIRALGKKALMRVWGKIYNLGLEPYNKRHASNIKGGSSSSFDYIGGFLLDSVADKESLKNSNYQELKGETNSSLDMIVNVILNDRGLNRFNTKSDLRAGAYFANEMNKLLVKGIKATGIANDGKFTPADIRALNNYLVQNYEEKWAELHGDDEDDYETGYHRVQNDGATTRMFGENVINTIADGIYHLGYKSKYKKRLVNEDGNANQTYEDVAWWLEISLKKDIKEGKFNNPNIKEVVATTNTSLDMIVPAIYNDEGLLKKVSLDDIRVAAKNANRMNELLIEAIKETGAAEDKYFSVEDIKAINRYLVDNYASEWAELHGDDEKNEETGFHRIQNDGALSRIEGRNLINTVADGIYHLGYKTKYKNNLVNEDGNKNVTFYSVAYWLNKYLRKDLQNGSLVK